MNVDILMVIYLEVNIKIISVKFILLSIILLCLWLKRYDIAKDYIRKSEIEKKLILEME